MIQAELKGKLPEVENKEDVLTSNVFGLISLLNFKEGLYPIIRNAQLLNSMKFEDVLLKNKIILKEYSHCNLLFWESGKGFGEPDIVVILKGTNQKDLMFVIEVKLYSDKSGVGEDDQLKKYYLSLYNQENRSSYGNGEISKFDGEFAGIIYLKPIIKKQEIIDSIKELSQLGIAAEDNIFCLEWSNIVEEIEKELKINADYTQRRVYQSIQNILIFKNLQDFKGWGIREFNLPSKEGIIFFQGDGNSFSGFSEYLGENLSIKDHIFYAEE